MFFLLGERGCYWGPEGPDDQALGKPERNSLSPQSGALFLRLLCLPAVIGPHQVALLPRTGAAVVQACPGLLGLPPHPRVYSSQLHS